MRLINFLLAFFLLSTAQGRELPPVWELQCEYMNNPIGIDTKQPRFLSVFKYKGTDPKMTYQVLVSTNPKAEDGNVWRSAKVNINSNLMVFQGKALLPFTKYYWKVQAYDHLGKLYTDSKVATFETGMMNMLNWQGAWISDGTDVNVKPAGMFRKEFETKKKVRSARAYIAVAGLYELYINGERIGKQRLDPMYTRFDRRTLYVTHNVTREVVAGKNAIGVMLGNGWYNHQSTAVWDFHKAPWRGRPTFCMDLRITYEDGSVETISTKKDWKTALGPVIFNSIYTGEHYDARLEQPGWNKFSFDDSKWRDVTLRSAPSDNIVAQVMRPIENVEEIPAAKMNKINDTTYVFDLGRNIAGVSKISVQGEAGTVLRLKHTELLQANGRGDMSNIDMHYRPTDDKDPFQTDIFILNGKFEETFSARFNYKGFQYVEVTSNKPITLTEKSLTGYFMHSNVPVVGHVKSSNPMINKLWEATNNAYLSNLFGYPTDCPQREKNGWTGDAHIASETGLYSFDAITVYEKWLADHRDEQQPNGVLPSIIPTGGWGYEWGNGPDWTSTIAIIPWNIYLFYGDTTLLGACYDNIKRYVDRIDTDYPSGLTTWGLGDWVPVNSKTPVELTSSAYYFADVTILYKAAKLLNKTADHQKYKALAEKIKAAFNAKYLNKETATYGTGVQTAMSVPLYWGLVPEEMKAKVAANLAKKVEADNFHLDVGLLGTKAILSALSDNGYADAAYKIASQETFPSWGWWIVNGATTLPENWRIESKNDNSRNHIMFGEIGAWLYKGLAGIKPDEQAPGFKNTILEPHFVTGLDQFEASHNDLKSSWRRFGDEVFYSVTVPPYTTATVRFDPGKKITINDVVVKNEVKLTAGDHIFKVK